ncbi:MAG: HDOD domain-containing protein, partial [Bdellovibrionales bacterium]|nr:HDOD domain-containing protein [Bdellovibrionales bacterium]
MADRLTGDSRSVKRVKRAVDYVGDYWFPVNPKLLEKIQERIQYGHYQEGNTRPLVDDLCADFSLFTFALKKLYGMLQREGLSAPANLHPVQMLEWAGTERLLEILSCEEADVSSHTLSAGGTLQHGRFQEMLISSTTAQTLSESYGIDKDTAYSAAVLRQLGLTLIAWNYPGLYEETVSSLKSGDSLEVRLAEKLGFSPQMLAIRIMNSWGISQETCAQLGLVEDPEEALFQAMGDTLIELCEVGEALARAHQPGVYPSARDDWEQARKEIERTLGADGMQLIHEKIQENAESYLSFIPDVFDFGLISEIELFESDEEINERNFGNPYLELCSPTLARSIRTLYGNIFDGHTRRQNIQDYIQDVIPAAKFTGGCIYTADPALMLLIPQNDFGSLRTRELKGVDYSI